MENKINNSNYMFSGLDTVMLAREYGTPLYVVSEDIIKEKCKEIRESFLLKYENVKAAYASKAFLNLAMCKIIEREGLYLDVVSGGELFTAIKADFPIEKIFFHGNNKSEDELQLAISKDIGRIVVDNLYELELINSISEKYNKKTNVLFRVTPGVESETHKYIITGQKDSKFGIPIVEDIIFKAIKAGIEYENINLLGFHFHVGSQIFDNKSYIIAAEKIMNLIKEAKDRFGFITRELNTGGGYGIYYAKGDDPKPLSYFTDAIMEKVFEKCKEFNLEIPTIIIEPGRWIIGDAGITLYTIGAIKEIPGIRTYVSIDGGMPDNPRPALYDSKYEAVVANKVNEPADNTVTIAGKCCETGDILIWDLNVPKIQPGDFLAVLSTGAYNYSMASNYNKALRPAVVLLNEGNAEVIVERETYEDLIAKNSIPWHLR
ncbi:diaminopimelate decarboxylase [Maledivibacter halophilus]|uniref:Diaminopimelate decarboxylase n=1 Tax=Maledivibacter halophilus TaxID=36842 RepID=A0A1T5JTX2_9FIRM|nr:diaminopimelate decarboxylase [Maledivibacter halophilus]SKC54804.1 diaminopimelate decarboxylase [Maledivibacter halophilus]